MVDTTVLEAVAKSVWVQVPPSAPFDKKGKNYECKKNI